MHTVRVACHMCGDTELAAPDVELVLNGPDNIDIRFLHCDTTTRRRLTEAQALALRAVNIPVFDERPAGERHCSCGLVMFAVGTAMACRNCDAPLPGLPPADKRGFRR